jgi:hypothetical protein
MGMGMSRVRRFGPLGCPTSFRLRFVVFFFLIPIRISMQEMCVRRRLGFVRCEAVAGGRRDEVVATLIVFLALTLLVLYLLRPLSERVCICRLVEYVLNHGHKLGVVRIFVIERPQSPGSRVAVVFERFIHG